MQLLKPLITKQKYIKSIEKVIKDFFIEYYINPLLDITKPLKDYYNSSDEDILIEAIKNQEIQYIDGYFFGKFNAKTSKAIEKMGGKWSKMYKAYKVEERTLSPALKGAIAYASLRALQLRKEIIAFLNAFRIEDYIPDFNKMLEVPLDWTLEDLDEQCYNNFYKWQQPKPDREKSKLRVEIEEAIRVSPDSEKVEITKEENKSEQFITQQYVERAKLSEEKREFLKKEYTENVDLSIKNFTDKEVQRLRELVEQNTFYGLDNTNLIETIQKEFNTTLKKATFLARNETGIFVAKYQEAQARELGLTDYVWLGADDEREREYHRRLNGLIFNYDNPPIVNEKGDRRNPKEDYNCRCDAMLVVRSMHDKIQNTDGKLGEKGSLKKFVYKQ